MSHKHQNRFSYFTGKHVDITWNVRHTVIIFGQSLQNSQIQLNLETLAVSVNIFLTINAKDIF